MRVFIVDEETTDGVVRQLHEADEAIERGLERQTEQTNDPFQTDVEKEEEEGEMDSSDETRLGPPFGIVINGQSLVSLCGVPLFVRWWCQIASISGLPQLLFLPAKVRKPGARLDAGISLLRVCTYTMQRYALKEKVKLQLLETAGKCQAVICCRVTPLQKVYNLW